MPKAGIRSKQVFLLILIMFLLLSFNQGAVFADTNTSTPSPTVTGTLTSTPVNSMFEISNPYWHSNPVNQNYVANLVNDFWVSQPTGSFQDLYINYRRSGTNLSYGASSNGVGVRVFFPVRQQSGAQRPLYAVVQYRASHPNVRYEITGCCGGRTWTWTANSFSPPYIGDGMWQGWINIPNSASYQNTSFWIGYSSGAIPLNANWWIEMTIHLSDGPVTDPYTPTSTLTSTPTDTPTATFTNTPTVTPTFTPTNTPIPSWYAGAKQTGIYGVKALISAPAQAPFIDGASPPSGQSNWVSIPAPYWIQAGWRYYENIPEGPVALPYVEWRMTSAPLGESAYGYRNYGEDIQAWGTSKLYTVEWLSRESWCGTVGDNTPICKIVGVSPPQDGFARSEVHASSLNQLNTLFSAVMYQDANGDWHLFDQGLWRMDSPYNIDIYSDSQFRNYGP